MRKNAMPFPEHEQQQLLALKGVGATVIRRLQDMGFSSLAELRDVSADDILQAGAQLTGSTCWKNSPQARAAIVAILELANRA